MITPLSLPGHKRLFQPWEASPAPDLSSNEPDEFLELPPVSSFEQLLGQVDYPDIKAQFLSDISELRTLARHFVNDEYDRALSIFHDNLVDPNRITADSLLPLYRDTRYQIHTLVQQLRDYQPGQTGYDHIAAILHDCLNGIHLCPDGVHSRFANVLYNLSSVRSEEIGGKLFKVRGDLYRNFIQSFMLQLQQKGVDLGKELEIHWFNGLYNLCCEALALPPVADHLANPYLSDNELTCYLTSASLSVNACTILRAMVDEWSGQLVATLASEGCSHWLSGTRADENTARGVNALDARVFNPINRQMETTSENRLSLVAVMECTTDDSFHLGRHREKLFAWVAGRFFGSDTRVFVSIGSSSGGHACIATINQLYFWVLRSDQPLYEGQALVFDPDQHLPVQLHHLQTIDFGTWSDATALALLTQALEQTVEVDEVAAFFLDPLVAGQIEQLPELVMQTLSTMLREKLIYASDDWQQSLCELVCGSLAQTTAAVPPTALNWLGSTPLLQTVLSRLQRAGRDISRVTAQLDTRQIAEFAPECLAQLFTGADCQRLFEQAFHLGQAQTVFNLLTTGHCDELIRNSGWSAPYKTIRMRRYDHFAGAGYLLARTDINRKDAKGMTPLLLAILGTHRMVARVLLKVPGIDVNTPATDGCTALYWAARHGYCDVVSALVEMPGIDVNSADGDGVTPLHWAVHLDHRTTVQALLRAPGIDVNAKAKKYDGMTPLILAANGNQLQSVKELLAAPDIDVNAITYSGRTALCIVAQLGYVDCLRELLKVTRIQVNLPVLESGQTALNCAVEKNCAECVRELLKVSDVDVNKADISGMTPLHKAAMSGFKGCLQALLYRPDIAVNQRNDDGASALHLAVARGEMHCVRMLRCHGDVKANVFSGGGWTPLSLAVISGHIKCVTELLAMPDIDVNAKIGGWSPLNSAAGGGLPDILNLLLAVPGIDINVRNEVGMTPLHCAVRCGHPVCAGALLAVPGVDVNAVTRSGFTPLNLAVKYGSLECVKLLLENTDVDVNLASHEGFTPLFSAVQQDQPDCLRALLNMPGVAINAVTNTGLTALDLAAEYGRLTCLEALLETGVVELNQQARYGTLPPLHRSAGNGFVTCVKALLGAPGIDINRQCDFGFTPLHLAAQKNHPECVRELLAVEGIEVNLPCRRGNTPLDSANGKGFNECCELITRKLHILSTFKKNSLLEKWPD